MNNLDVKVHNKFEILVRDAKTNNIIESKECYNIILDRFWGNFLKSSNTAALSNIHFGSGTSEPQKTDTTLTSKLGSKSATNITFDYSTLFVDGVIRRRSQIRLEAAEYAGQTISEVGLGENSTNVNTKALLVDMNGNPISIQKTDLTVVDIFSTFYAVVPIHPQEGVIITSSPTYNVSARILQWLLCNDSYFPGQLEFLMSKPSKVIGLDSGTNGSITHGGNTYTRSPTVTFDIPQKKMLWNMSNINAADLNIGGIRGVHFPGGVYIDIPNATCYLS